MDSWSSGGGAEVVGLEILRLTGCAASAGGGRSSAPLISSASAARSNFSVRLNAGTRRAHLSQWVASQERVSQHPCPEDG